MLRSNINMYIRRKGVVDRRCTRMTTAQFQAVVFPGEDEKKKKKKEEGTRAQQKEEMSLLGLLLLLHALEESRGGGPPGVGPGHG